MLVTFQASKISFLNETAKILKALITNIMLLKLVWILRMFGGKFTHENAENDFSERLHLEIFWGVMPPDHP